MSLLIVAFTSLVMLFITLAYITKEQPKNEWEGKLLLLGILNYVGVLYVIFK